MFGTSTSSCATTVTSWDHKAWSLPAARQLNGKYGTQVDSLEILSAAQMGAYLAQSTWNPAKGPAPAWAYLNAYYRAMDVVSFYLPHVFQPREAPPPPTVVSLFEPAVCKTVTADTLKPFSGDLSGILGPLNETERQVALLRFVQGVSQVNVASTMRLSDRQIRYIEASIRGKVPRHPEPWDW